MSWKSNGKWSKGAWQEWDPKKQKKDPKDNKAKGHVMYAWDGRRINLDADDGNGKSSSAVSSSSSDSQLRLENQKIKQAVRKIMDSETPGEEEVEILRDLVKPDPRDQLKERQKQLNLERRSLNRAAKLKEDMTEKENGFGEWVASQRRGIEKEEKRHASEMAEIRDAIRAAEEREMADKDTARKETDENMSPSHTENSTEALQQELDGVKQQMTQFTTYVATMEEQNKALLAQNQVLTEQMAMLVSSLHNRDARIDLKDSPQHPFRLDQAANVGERVAKRSPNRSRSPPAHTQGKKPKKGQVDHSVVKQVISALEETSQQMFLQEMQRDPEKYSSMDAVMDLMERAKQWEASAKQQQAEKAALLAAQAAKIPVERHGTVALLPFRGGQPLPTAPGDAGLLSLDDEQDGEVEDQNQEYKTPKTRPKAVEMGAMS